jgi:hypothetical protein
MSAISSGAFHAFSPVPVDLIAVPPISRLSETQTAQLSSLHPGQIGEQYFPPITVGFKISADFAPLADPGIESNGGTNPPGTREYAERVLYAPVGRWVELQTGDTTQITAFGDCAQMVLGWARSAVGATLEVRPDQNDYWEGRSWKYERAFFVNDDGYWLTPFAYENGQNPQVESNGYLFELATKISTDSVPVITTGQLPAITKYFVPQPPVSANALTTKQLDTLIPENGIGSLPEQYRAAPFAWVSNNAGFEPTSACANAATWARSFDTLYTGIDTSAPAGLTGGSTFWSPWSTADMAGEALHWVSRVDTGPEATQKWNLAQLGAFYNTFGAPLRPMYERNAVRSVPALYPSRNAYAFGDFHGLSYAGIYTSTIGEQSILEWYTLCKVQRTIHFLQIKMKELNDYFGTDYEIRALGKPYGDKLDYELKSKTFTGDLLFLPLYDTGPGIIQIGQYAARGFGQCVGFEVEQAQRCFPVNIDSINVYWLIDAETVSPNIFTEYLYAGKFINYTVSRYDYDDVLISQRSEVYSDFFPYQPIEDSPPAGRFGGYYGALARVSLKRKQNQDGFFYETIDTQVIHTPTVTNCFSDYYEVWIPEAFNAANSTWAESFCDCVANFYTDLINSVEPAGSFEVMSSDGTAVINRTLYGVPKIGTLRIRWTPEDLQ